MDPRLGGMKDNPNSPPQALGGQRRPVGSPYETQQKEVGALSYSFSPSGGLKRPGAPLQAQQTKRPPPRFGNSLPGSGATASSQEMPSSMLQSMMSGISNNFSGLSQQQPQHKSPFGGGGGAFSKPGQQLPSQKGGVGGGHIESQNQDVRRNIFYDSDTSAIEGLMLMKSASQIPQNDGQNER
uniref:Uncharacterized protein n=1 Tax=Paramoeba aestuarina TaxID=180227 RepID=A0A7S4NWP4_9EUKA